MAAQEGHAYALDILCAAGCDVNKAREDGWTALMTATYWNNLESVRVLLRHGADTSLATTSRLGEVEAGSTAISFARQDHAEMLQLLSAEPYDSRALLAEVESQRSVIESQRAELERLSAVGCRSLGRNGRHRGP